jgi:diguanylate cyclase (GGDEF)-like protein
MRQPAIPEIVAPAAGAENTGDTTDHDEVDALQLRLARNVADALARNRTFDALLRNSLDALHKAGGGEDIDELKDVLSKGLEELLKEQNNLGRNLSTTTTYLNAIHTDRRKLRDALSSARKHSLSDELTGLPNRTAFMRQLEGEIGRAKRYGFSLAVAIIDVDGLRSVNETHGRPVGDAVLQCYTREVMSLFRGYDMVARYGADEFAVLFPNTQKDGASRAIEKAQKRAAETYINYNNRNIPLPSFSSVLTLYVHGEKPATMIQRASEALDHAKQRGQGQLVVALPGN